MKAPNRNRKALEARRKTALVRLRASEQRWAKALSGLNKDTEGHRAGIARKLALTREEISKLQTILGV